MSTPPDDPPEPLPITLEAALSEIAVLRQKVRQLPVEPEVVIDAEGTCVEVHHWAWANAPAVGRPFVDALAGEARADVSSLIERGWIGAEEVRLRVGGAVLALTVVPHGSGHRVTLRDVTRRHALDEASEERRRMRALAELATSLARELADPMSIVQGRLELLRDVGVADPVSVRRHLDAALEHTRRVTATLSNLRLVGRTAEPSSAPVRAQDAIQDALDLVGPRRNQVLVTVDAELSIGCDSALAARVLASLVRQSTEAVGRGSVHLKARRDKGVVLVKIGPSGRAGAELPVSAEELALDRTLLASVGGRITAFRQGSALRFEVVLPSGVALPRKRAARRGRIAVVGASVRQSVPLLLERDGYDFVTASTADEALALLERTPVDAVFVELLLDGGASGLAVADALRKRPNPPKLVVVHVGPEPQLPEPILPLRWPVGRAELLEALGRRVRR